MDADIAEAALGGPLQQATQVVDMAVDAAVRTQSDQVESSWIRQQGVRQVVECRIGRQGTVAYGLADADQFLANDAAGTDRQMPHL